jgi:drug/metabolite transporter (DMT)-like permease
VVSGCCWSLTLLGLRWIEKRDPASKGGAAGNAAIVGNILAWAGCLPLALPVAGVSVTDAIGVAYLGVFQVGLAYVLLTRSITYVPAVEASLLLLVEPALSPLWAWLLHGESPGLWPFAGGVLIIGAAAWKSLRASRSMAR